MDPWLIAVLLLALSFNFFNGYNDAASIAATVIFSRSISPRLALLVIALAEFIGPFLFGLAVARSIGAGLADPHIFTTSMLVAALISAVVWGYLSARLGLPSSSSHALVGGIIGAVWAAAGLSNLLLPGLGKVVLALFISPPLGALFGFLMMKLIFFLARKATLKINRLFKGGQVLTAFAVALSHGSNDAQKTMAVITLGLMASGVLQDFNVPGWVVIVSAAGIALGAGLGGQRMLRTVGGKYYRIRPVDGFATQLASASVILSAGLLGGPVSTTQVINSAIIGVGSAERMNKIRWNVAGQIVAAWVITIPVTALLSAGITALLRLLPT